MIFQITEPVPRGTLAMWSRGKNSVRLSHAALLSLHCLGNTNNYKCFPKHFQHFLYFIQNKQEMTAVFSVINYECPACFCSTVEPCYFVCIYATDRFNSLFHLYIFIYLFLIECVHDFMVFFAGCQRRRSV